MRRRLNPYNVLDMLAMFAVWILAIGTIGTAGGCTVHVDKRSWITINLQTSNDIRSIGGTVSLESAASAPAATTNTSDTQAEQAIDGKLSIPLTP